MNSKYRLGHRLPSSKKKHILVVSFISLLVIALIGGVSTAYIQKSIDNKDTKNLSGPPQSVGQVLGDSTDLPSQLINEPTFTISLPDDWKQTGEVNTDTQHSISWQSTLNSRWMTVYIDIIPTSLAINRLLPIYAQGQTLSYGNLSDNCVDFTNPPNDMNSIMAKWDGVNFLCNIPDRFDDVVGTGSTAGINSVTVAGPQAGSHNYFFVYTDHDADPDYTIFYSILNTFRAK